MTRERPGPVPPSLEGATAAGERVPDSFRELVTEMVPMVWRVLRRCGVEDADLDDAQQSVFVQVSRRWAVLAGADPRERRAYVLCVATGTARQFGRGQARRFRTEGRMPAEVTDPSPGPDSALEHKRRTAVLDQVLASMAEPLREVFVLYELEELTGREIAQHLGIPAGTVASRLRKARAHFERVGKQIVGALEPGRGS